MTKIAREWDAATVARGVAAYRGLLPIFLNQESSAAQWWPRFVLVGRALVNILIETKSIPRGKEKAAELAFRLFLTVSRTRDVTAWMEKNRKHLLLINDAIDWPNKGPATEDSEELFPLEGFSVHNTMGLAGSKLDTTKEVISKAVRAIKASDVPNISGLFYGPLYIVGQLKQSRTLAWYNFQSDEVFLRPHLKAGPGEVHSLIHELSHRYWYKTLAQDRKRAWATYHMMAGFSNPHVEMPKVGEPVPVPIAGHRVPPTISAIEGDKILLNTGGAISYRKLRQVLTVEASFPTPYAASNAEEHFAESTALYCLRALDGVHKAAFEALIIQGERSFDPRMIQRVASRYRRCIF